jgi:hypothetical protein
MLGRRSLLDGTREKHEDNGVNGSKLVALPLKA